MLYPLLSGWKNRYREEPDPHIINQTRHKIISIAIQCTLKVFRHFHRFLILLNCSDVWKIIESFSSLYSQHSMRREQGQIFVVMDYEWLDKEKSGNDILLWGGIENIRKLSKSIVYVSRPSKRNCSTYVFTSLGLTFFRFVCSLSD